MAFEYTPYRSPYAGAIAGLISKQGDIAAERAMQQAKIRSAMASNIASSLGQLAQYQADAPKRRLEEMRLAEAQQSMADAAENRQAGTTLAQLLTDPERGNFQPQGPDLSSPTGVLPEQDGFTTTVDGVELFDKNKVAQRMAAAGHGRWMLDHGSKIDDLNKSLLETAAIENKSLQQAAMTWAALPDELQVPGAAALLKPMQKRLSPEQVSVLQRQIENGDVAGLRAAIAPMLPKAETQMLSAGATMVQRQPDGSYKTVASGAPVQESKAQYDARVNAARAKIAAGTATPEERALVSGVDADIAARRTPQSVPLDREHADLLTKKAQGTLTPAETMRLQSIEQVRKFIPQFNVENRQEPSDVSSYNAISSRIETIAKPVSERVERLQRIVDTLNTPNAVADSLVAPELLSAMAAGAGSGIRINEAEINRVLGARSTLDSVRAMLMRVKSGQTVTPEVRKQMNALVSLVKDKIDRKVEIINEARQALAKSESVQSQRQIFADMNQKLGDIDAQGSKAKKVGAFFIEEEP